MIDKKIITTRLTALVEYLQELKPILDLSLRDITHDYKILRTLERDFQLIVDTMIEVNTHIIARMGFDTADDFQSTFKILGKYKVIPENFAGKISPVVGLRNLIVHQYGKVDQKEFIEHLKKGSKDFEQYIRHIQKWVKKQR